MALLRPLLSSLVCLHLLLLLLLPPVLAQSTQLLDFSPTALPPCATQCQSLYTAQAGCVPPAAPVSVDDTYHTCFCQSNFLHTLYSSTAGLCDGACPPEGLTQIRTWYLALCLPKSATTTTSAGTPTADPTTALSASASTGGTNAGAGTSPSAAVSASPLPPSLAPAPPGSWSVVTMRAWKTHWRWVLMVIVIAVGAVACAIAGVLFKRYRKRKTAAATEPVAWGPHQHQNFTQGFNPAYDDNETGAARSRAPVRAVDEKDGASGGRKKKKMGKRRMGGN
ncbi:MAG: hypothetical protein M1826_000573 [Phylliscum demangeonii]|nr:MAG: hypothetical protein M1826_000573 [Phylliscum demangeonii]